MKTHPTSWLGLDVGGANLKAADGRGFAVVRPFPLWKQPAELGAALSQLVADSPSADALAVTMTGELADCFVTKAEGVRAILMAVETAAAGRPICVYRTDGRWAAPGAAGDEPLLAAASNWHALACFAARYVPPPASLLIDIGSTTTDIIPLIGGRPAAQGRTDPERMVVGELVYTGVQRSPVCAVARHVPWRGHLCPTAQELFATMWDAYLVLGDLPEEPHSTHTADGRPATKQAARDRLARSICADGTMVDSQAAQHIAHAVAEAQLGLVTEATARVIASLPQPPTAVVLSGVGEFLGRRTLHRLAVLAPTVSLAEHLGPSASRAATAHALAVLAAEAMP